MKPVNFPSWSPTPSTVFIGRNRSGNWVALEEHGVFGGLFVNRAQAVKYALFENGKHSQTVIEVSHELELDTVANP
ncbi:hypothetical protein [Bradyrhizobium canariense]|uniref:hypothetical protein n=1 Tax=Bradyrhizobium canariense TaxID=255045 RepID=UPI0035DB44EC